MCYTYMNMSRFLVLLLVLLCPLPGMGDEFLEPFDLIDSPNLQSHRIRRAPSGISTPYKPLSVDAKQGSKLEANVTHEKSLNLTTAVKSLYNHIFDDDDYMDRAVRPAIDDNQMIKVKFWFQLTEVISIHPVTHTMNFAGLMCMSWTDQRLQWNSTDYADIGSIRLHEWRIWTPLIALEHGENMDRREYTPIVVQHSGSVQSCKFVEVRTLCRLNLATFPYDEHTCHLTFITDGLTGQGVFFEVQPVHHGESIRYGEWSVTPADQPITVRRMRADFSTLPLPPSGIVLELKLTRSSAHFRWSVCVPTAALLLVCLVSAWIPYRHLRIRQVLLSGLLLGNVLLLKHTGRLLDGAEQLPTILLLQCVCVGLITVNIVTASIRQALTVAEIGGNAKIEFVLQKLDVVCLPIAGIALIVWTFGVL